MVDATLEFETQINTERLLMHKPNVLALAVVKHGIILKHLRLVAMAFVKPSILSLRVFPRDQAADRIKLLFVTI